MPELNVFASTSFSTCFSLPSRKRHFPRLAVSLHPIHYFGQFIQLDFAVAFAALLAHDHQSAFGKNLDVFGNSRPADIKMRGDPIEGEKQQRDGPSSVWGVAFDCALPSASANVTVAQPQAESRK